MLLAYLGVARYLDLPLIFVLYIGWNSNPLTGAASGTLFGLIQDVVYDLYLGLNGLSKTLMGFCGAYLSRWVPLEEGSLRPLLFALLSLLDSCLVWSLLTLLTLPVKPGFWAEAMVRSMVTALVAEVVFRIYDRIKSPPKDFRRL